MKMPAATGSQANGYNKLANGFTNGQDSESIIKMKLANKKLDLIEQEYENFKPKQIEAGHLWEN